MATSLDIQTEIKNIVNNRSLNRAQKHEALIKVGLRPADIRTLEFAMKMGRKSTTLKIGKYTFGVEIECINAERYALVDAVMNKGVQIAFEGYHHQTRDYFKLVTDSSLHGADPIECVSPVIKTKKDENSLKKVCEALDTIGATVNRSCGLHVHIGAENFSGEHYVNVFKNYQACEAVIDTFMANSRRVNNSQWCASLRVHNFDACRNAEDVRRELRYDRYHKVNAEAYSAHRTIEFRQHQGTTNYKKIIMWVQFLKELVDYSKNNVITEMPTSIDDLPFASDDVKTFFKGRADELR